MKKNLFVLLILFFALLPVKNFAQSFKLTVLHNSDGESKLISAGSDVLSDFGGIAKFKTLKDSLMARASLNGYSVLTLSAGDNFRAGPEFYISQQLPSGQNFYDSRALNYVGYDALALSNHEFDFGPDVAAKYVTGFENNLTSILCANLNFSQEDSLQNLVNSGKIKKYIIVNFGNEKVGVIGIVSPSLRYLSSPRNVIIDTNIVQVVNSLCDTLTNLGVNKIVLISPLESLKEDSLFATKTRGIDIIVSGTGTELLAKPNSLLAYGDSSYVVGNYPKLINNSIGQSVYLVKAGSFYKYLGKLDVEFNTQGVITSVGDQSGIYRVVGGNYPDAVVKNIYLDNNIVQPLQNALNSLASNIIGNTEVELDGIQQHLRTKETNLGDMVADAVLWKAKQLASQFGVPSPTVTIQNGGGIRNNSLIPVGNLSELSIFSILPFPNFVTIVPNITPSQLKELLENSVSKVEIYDGRFAQISGMQLIFNPNAQAQIVNDEGQVITPGNRIREIKLLDGTLLVSDGTVIANAPSVTIATNDFVARGGDQYPFRNSPFTNVGVSYQNTLTQYIQQELNSTITSAKYPAAGLGRITSTATGINEPFSESPSNFNLFQNHPNPFNPSTMISFQLPVSGNVSLKLYDLLGNEIATLIDKHLSNGTHSFPLDANALNLSSGVYIYQIISGSFISAKKMALIK